MTPLRATAALLSVLLLACEPGLEPAPPERLKPAEELPTPSDEDLEAVDLASSVGEITMEDQGPSAFAMLTQGKDEPTPTPARAKQTNADPGLGDRSGPGLSAGQIKQAIRPNLAQVQACYEQELKKGPEFGGKVVVSWTVGADGAVRSPRIVRNLTGNSAMLPCIQRAVARWRFPRAEGPTDIEYPFRFRPSDF